MYKILMRQRRGHTTEKLWLTDITLTPVYATVSRAEFQTEAGMDRSGDPPVGIDKKENAIHIVKELFGMYHKKSTTFTIVGHGDSWTFHRDQMYASKRARLNPVKGKSWTIWEQLKSSGRMNVLAYAKPGNERKIWVTATNRAVEFPSKKEALSYVVNSFPQLKTTYNKILIRSPAGNYHETAEG